MPVPSPTDSAEGEETVIEFAVRERLTKEAVVELLISMGGQRQGSRDELCERLLAIRGLKARDVLGKLGTDDLKLIARRFDVPESPKSTSPFDFVNRALSDEKSSLVKRIEEFAAKQRAPRSRSSPTVARPAPPTPPSPPQTPTPEPARTPHTPVPSPGPSALPPEPASRGTTYSSPAPPLVGLSDQGMFDGLCKFLESYTFTKRWTDEGLFEAELGGAISGHFPGQKVVHQMAVGGTKADIVACGAVIEIKYPKNKQPLQTLTGQVEGYQRLFGNRVVVVICSGGMNDVQALSDSAASLGDRGVKVYIK
jgi:hypothetical protein